MPYLELRDADDTAEAYVARTRGFDSVVEMRKHFFMESETRDQDPDPDNIAMLAKLAELRNI